MVDFVKMPNRGLSGLIQIKLNEDGTIKSTIDKFLNEEQLREIANAMGASKGDLILIAVEKEAKVRKALGDLRLELGKKQNWIDKDKWSILWIVDFPLFEKDEETGNIIFVHHPFCNVHPDETGTGVVVFSNTPKIFSSCAGEPGRWYSVILKPERRVNW